MTANKRVSPHAVVSDLARFDAHVIQPHEYEALIDSGRPRPSEA